jgi:uncharacterized membrane protein
MSEAAGSPPRDPRNDNLIPFPSPAGPQMPATGTRLAPTPEVLDGELVGRPEFTRRPMPVVLPTWLRSWEIALGTLRWALRRAPHRLSRLAYPSLWIGAVLVDPAWYRSGARCRVPVGERAR